VLDCGQQVGGRDVVGGVPGALLQEHMITGSDDEGGAELGRVAIVLPWRTRRPSTVMKARSTTRGPNSPVMPATWAPMAL